MICDMSTGMICDMIRPEENDDPSLCATLYTVGGVGELYQRRSSLL
jgi:hypothetical protein